MLVNITIRGFNSELDFWDLQDWVKNRGLKPYSVTELPKLGAVVEGQEEIHGEVLKIAAGFIRQAEGHVGIFDSFISNPAIDPETRNTALELLTKGLLNVARSEKFSKLLAFSTDKNTLIRAERNGFCRLPYSLLSLSLDDQEVISACPL